MLVFIIPLKSSSVSDDWSKTCKLFEKCIRSVCGQTSNAFKVVVVCNEIPEINFKHHNIDYEVVNFKPPQKASRLVRNTDKGKRILKGMFSAKKYSPSHVMVVDADDYISNRLAAFVEKRTHANGWYVNKGFKYINEDLYVYPKYRNFHWMCGTSNILNFQLLELPGLPEYNRGYGYYKFYIDHRKIREVMEQRGFPIKALPFPGTIYVLATGENNSKNEEKLSFNFLFRKKLSCKLRQEFGLL
jgi:hypothetical protein